MMDEYNFPPPPVNGFFTFSLFSGLYGRQAAKRRGREIAQRAISRPCRHGRAPNGASDLTSYFS